MKKMAHMIFLIGSFLIIIFLYFFYYIQIPSELMLPLGDEQELVLGIPASATIETKSGSVVTSLSKPVTLKAGNKYHNYKMQVKLLGVIPLKNVEIQVVKEQSVYVAGVPIGIFLKTTGVMVIQTGSFTDINGETQAPSAYKLQTGDYILQYNGTEITGKQQFLDFVAESKGEEITFLVKRNAQVMEIKVTPARQMGDVYKFGIWIRDNAQGVGTLTFVDDNGNFGALGHGITDGDTGLLLRLGRGSLYETSIIGVRKGKKGIPGELSGLITYDDSNIVGEITENTECGIFGTTDVSRLGLPKTKVPVAMKQEIKLGSAQMISAMDGTLKSYEIRIDAIHLGGTEGNKGLEISVVDPVLLSETGGIVQGLSGAPIVQNGKLVGAVTHVFVNDPTKGYGIFAETMLLSGSS